MKKDRLLFVSFGLGWYAFDRQKIASGDYLKLAYISQHGSIEWKLDQKQLSALPFDIAIRIQNFAAGVAHVASVEAYERGMHNA